MEDWLLIYSVSGFTFAITFWGLYGLFNDKQKFITENKIKMGTLLVIFVLSIYMIGKFLSNGWNYEFINIADIKGGTKVWIGFWGSILGGIIGSLSVIYVAKIQNEQQIDNIRKVESDNRYRLFVTTKIEMLKNYLDELKEFENKLSELESTYMELTEDRIEYFVYSLQLRPKKQRDDTLKKLGSLMDNLSNLRNSLIMNELILEEASNLEHLKNLNLGLLLKYLNIRDYKEFKEHLDKELIKIEGNSFDYIKELDPSENEDELKKIPSYKGIKEFDKVFDEIFEELHSISISIRTLLESIK
ncbi:hypothetical protein [Macrococcoides caseolyticum]|uniref:Uncharacterized protein n=1 Tax=Macrococcoides caseolyticum TaxID=69966 RepID=A0A855GSB7_9STAP|nr:hypothetical protein [Macrococcus caseolyticus]PKE27146.1 hypothetical protein CW686_01495 [Macrococcus caseolyticus]PKE59631.1 hypothetical protein CW673_01445 [Macrococcus caseolyticus]PKE71136.1 hypothetical protein CW662_01160 [Macrococcus caseolyticus]